MQYISTRGQAPTLDSEDTMLAGLARDGRAVTQQMAALNRGGAFEISQGAITHLRANYASGRASEAETSATITRVHAQTGHVLCPHSAVAVNVACGHISTRAPMITLATAHPAKFADAVRAATGQHPALPSHMADLLERHEHIERVDNDTGALKTLIKERLKL